MDIWVVKVSTEGYTWIPIEYYTKEVSAQLHAEYLSIGQLQVKIEKINLKRNVSKDISEWMLEHGKSKIYTE
jgi:hypothetical protein